jgi:hypothetical protein
MVETPPQSKYENWLPTPVSIPTIQDWGSHLDHRGSHSRAYSEALTRRLDGVSNRLDILDTLEDIREELMDLDDQISEQIQRGERDFGNTAQEWANRN